MIRKADIFSKIYELLKKKYDKKSVLDPPYIFISLRFVNDLRIPLRRGYDFTPLGFYFYPIGSELFERYPTLEALPYRTEAPFLVIGEINKNSNVVRATDYKNILEMKVSPEMKALILKNHDVDVVIDDGYGFIHINEPVQGFILPPVKKHVTRISFVRNPLIVSRKARYVSHSISKNIQKNLVKYFHILQTNPSPQKRLNFVVNIDDSMFLLILEKLTTQILDKGKSLFVILCFKHFLNLPEYRFLKYKGMDVMKAYMKILYSITKDVWQSPPIQELVLGILRNEPKEKTFSEDMTVSLSKLINKIKEAEKGDFACEDSITITNIINKMKKIMKNDPSKKMKISEIWKAYHDVYILDEWGDVEELPPEELPTMEFPWEENKK